MNGVAPMKKKLSVVMPCYNEEATLKDIVSEVKALASDDLDLEVLIVDDCSTDASRRVAEEIAAADPAVRVLRHEANQGKGAALRTGFLSATGDFVCVQDADLEYDPKDYLKMLRTLREEGADVVFGSRYLPRDGRRALRWWHSTMNRFLTLCSNVLSDLALTDMETCYKLFTADVIREMRRPCGRTASGSSLSAWRPSRRERGGRDGASMSAQSATVRARSTRGRRSAGGTASVRSGASCGTTCGGKRASRRSSARASCCRRRCCRSASRSSSTR